jgi:hypothetical protein
MRVGGSGNCARGLLSGGGGGGAVRGGGGPIQRPLHRLRRRQLLVGAPLRFAKRIFGSGGSCCGGVGWMSVRRTEVDTKETTKSFMANFHQRVLSPTTAS